MKIKDALSSVYGNQTVVEILNFIEEPATKWTGGESMNDTYDEAQIQG